MNFLIKFLFNVASFFLHLLPRRVQLWVGNILGLLWFDVFRIRRSVALANLKLAFPDWTEADRIRTGRASLVNMGQSIVELILMVRYPHQRIAKDFVVEGIEHVEAALALGKGALVLSLHVGNGDYGCMALSLMGFKLNMISKQFKSPALNEFWFGTRRLHGTKFIREEKSSFDILKALGRNEIVIFILDQFMGPPVGVKTLFFGVPTGTAMGLAVFQDRTRVPLIPAYNERLKDGRFRIVFEKPIEFEDKGTREKNNAFMTQIYSDKIEQIVRAHPDQWMWIHRRWKEFRE
jgi:KDO2-lipid IV(A) lauroyltransferase